eukprot:6259440-Ditylum_brightwellii.AAC.1
MSKRDGTSHGKKLLFTTEDDLSELYLDIIGDLDINDDEYDPDIKHLLSYPNNNKTKQVYINCENQFKTFCKSHKCIGFDKPKQ